jgi:hypothetical protein
MADRRTARNGTLLAGMSFVLFGADQHTTADAIRRNGGRALLVREPNPQRSRRRWGDRDSNDQPRSIEAPGFLDGSRAKRNDSLAKLAAALELPWLDSFDRGRTAIVLVPPDVYSPATDHRQRIFEGRATFGGRPPATKLLSPEQTAALFAELQLPRDDVKGLPIEVPYFITDDGSACAAHPNEVIRFGPKDLDQPSHEGAANTLVLTDTQRRSATNAVATITDALRASGERGAGSVFFDLRGDTAYPTGIRPGITEGWRLLARLSTTPSRSTTLFGGVELALVPALDALCRPLGIPRDIDMPATSVDLVIPALDGVGDLKPSVPAIAIDGAQRRPEFQTDLDPDGADRRFVLRKPDGSWHKLSDLPEQHDALHFEIVRRDQESGFQGWVAHLWNPIALRKPGKEPAGVILAELAEVWTGSPFHRPDLPLAPPTLPDLPELPR